MNKHVTDNLAHHLHIVCFCKSGHVFDFRRGCFVTGALLVLRGESYGLMGHYGASA